MRRALLAIACVLLAAASLPAFDVAGILRKLDVENGVLLIELNGQRLSMKVGRDVKVLDKEGRPLAGSLNASELKEGTEVTVSFEGHAQEFVATTIRLGRVGVPEPKASVGLTPLSELTAKDKYKGEDGGLYGGGRNQPSDAHLKIAQGETAKIGPLDANGNPASDGAIGLVSISMSNATQEFSRFKQLADADPKKSPNVAIVDCAQGGQAMAEWVDPRGPAWIEADRRLEGAKVSPSQVQVVWVKLANILPSGDLTDHGKKLQKDTLAVLQNAKGRFPNLRVAYLGSRIYGGWTTIPLNPEPYAYEGAFVVRWLIQDQIKGDPSLTFDPSKGAVKAPLLLWGPYLWADGTTARKSDGLTYERADLAADGTHPSESGRQKVANLLLTFFQTDPLARTWYLKKQPTSSPPA
jgi:hypothetical protein